MILYTLLAVLSAVACGLAGYSAYLHTRLAMGRGGFGRKMEGSYAAVKAGWAVTTGTILIRVVIVPPPPHASSIPWTLVYLIGLACSSLGMMRLVRPTVDRLVEMEIRDGGGTTA